MGRVFVSYRRKESADFTGRLFDRLAGYFGNQNVYMDVDDLISGKDYRAQIADIIADCDVLLAIIGEQWLDIADEKGNRRLEDPDDQLRIEIETALEQEKLVIPVLIHGAGRPLADRLPDSLAPLANLRAFEVGSGYEFDTDVQQLLEHLEDACGIRNPDRRFPLELILIPLGVLLIAFGVLSIDFLPSIDSNVSDHYDALRAIRFSGGDTSELMRDAMYAPGDYVRSLWDCFLYCTLPLSIGPMLIVFGKRWCCMTKEARTSRPGGPAGLARRPPKSSAAVLSLALGLASPSLGIVTSIPAVFLGIWTFVDTRHRQGWLRGQSLAIVGIIAAILGSTVTWWIHLPLWRFVEWNQHADEARSAWVRGELDQAAAQYAAASEAASGNVRYWTVARLLEAGVLQNAEKYEPAIEVLTEVIERLKPLAAGDERCKQYLGDAYSQRASVFWLLGDTEAAKADEQQSENLHDWIEADGFQLKFNDPVDNTGDEQSNDWQPPPALPAPDMSNSATSGSGS